MVSQLQTVGEHTFEIPSPISKEEILFIDQKDPVWDRNQVLLDYKPFFFDFMPGREGTKLYQEASLYNNDGLLVSLNKEDSDWMVWAYEREWKRRTQGVHVKIGDKIEWLTGDCYFILMWCKTKRPDKKGDYFDYREFQQRFLQLIWYINQQDIISC